MTVHDVDVESTFHTLMNHAFTPAPSPVPAPVPVRQAGARVTEALRPFSTPEFFQSLSSYDATELVGQLQAMVSQIEFIKAHAVVAAVGSVALGASSVRKGSDVSLEDVRSTELGAYLGISPLAARHLAEHCRVLVRWLPSTLDHLKVGNCDIGKARLISDGARTVYSNMCRLDSNLGDVHDPRVLEMMTRYERIVTRNIVSRTYSQTKADVKRAIALLTPLAEDARHLSARENREVAFFDQGDGMTIMQALITNMDAAKVKNVLEHCTRNDATLSGTVAQRMSDALVGIITGQCDIAPDRRMSAAQVNVVVSVDTLLGLSDEPAAVIGSDFVLTSTAVRELAQDSHLRRMIVDDSTGALLELGRKSYEPSRQIKDFVKLRDQKCRAPGCVRNAMKCDVDHIEAWDDGGQTNVDNLASLCRRHHILKTIGTWQYELKPNGDTHWRLPDGHVVIDYAHHWIEPAHEPEPCPF